MSTQEELQKRQEALQSLERIQAFDAQSLVREVELGSKLNFYEALEPANRLILLFKQVSPTVLEDIPNRSLDSLRDVANTTFSYLDEILHFTPEQDNPVQTRNNLISKITNAYQGIFDALLPIIAYSMSKSADYKRLESDARATIQDIKDEAANVTTQLHTAKDESQKILEDIKKVAAEQGVTQQAFYFKEEAILHNIAAQSWEKRTYWFAALLALYATASMFFHKIPWIAPADQYQTIQLVTSKILIFAVISYLLYLSGRNFLSHKHNAIINKHRQNALMTFQTLADAAKDVANRDVVLMQAAACVFSPQNTGYAQDGGLQAPSAKSVVELLAKPMSGQKE